MRTHPPEDWLSGAEMKKAEALRLLSAGKPREALNLLNRAIQQAPNYAPLFATRAQVFEHLGMERQAEGDRRHVDELQARFGEAPPEREPAAPHQPPMEAAEQQPEVPATTLPDGPRAPSRGIVGGFAGVLGAIVLLVVVSSGVILAVLSLLGQEDTVPGISRDTRPTMGASPTPAATATPEPVPNVAGSPYDLDEVQTAWTARGIGAAADTAPAGFSGFAVGPAPVRLTRAGESLELAVLVYGDPAAARQDWNLPAGGARPSPREGRSIPSHISIWWNQNTVVVVLSGSPALARDALEAFLDLSP